MKGRKHSSFPRISANPLKTWDVRKTRDWIEGKKKQLHKFRGIIAQEENNDSESDSDQESDDDTCLS